MRNFWSAITLFSLCLAFIGVCFYVMSTTLWSFSYTTLIVIALLFVLIIYTLLQEYKQLSRLKKVVAYFVNTISILFTSIIILFFSLKIVVYSFGGTEQLLTSYSPNMGYTLDFYAFDAGAMGSFGIRGELDGPFGFKKQVYYEKHAEEAVIQWLTNDIVVINGHELNLTDGETFGYKIKTR
ncbi:MAG: DUF5412 family protein [Solibacillus sp.]